MNTMLYIGYIGQIEYDDECCIFSGSVVNTRTVITFQGTSVDELEREFHISVEDYLEWCAEENIPPEKPYSGKIHVRLKPDTHQRAAVRAKSMGISLNSFIEKAVEDEINYREG